MTETLSAFGLGSEVLVWQAVLLTFISFAVGVLGGFVGLALGTMRLPALLLLGVPSALAGGTNIMVSGLSALTGSIRHLREGRVDKKLVLTMGVPAFIGVFIGGFGSDLVSDSILRTAAGVLVLWQGVEFLMRVRGGASSASSLEGERGQFTPSRVAAEGAIGFSVGLLGGAVGLILGSIRLPAMVRILRVDPRLAAGSNLFIGLVMGALGWVGHVAQGQVDFAMVALMGAGGMAGSYYGAKLTGRVSLDRLVLVMGFVLLAVGALLIWQGLSS